jgi:O-antigen ligase
MLSTERGSGLINLVTGGEANQGGAVQRSCFSRLALGSPGCLVAIILAASIALSSTTGVGIGSSWFDEQRIISLVFLAAAALVFLPALTQRPGTTAVLLACMLGLGAMSALLAARPFVAGVDWSIYCLMAILVVGARSVSRRSVELTAAVVAGVVATSYVGGVLANYTSSLLLGFPIGAETLLVGFSNPRFPAQLQALTVPLLPLALQLAPKGFWRGCATVVSSMWWMCLIGSGSRTGWIAVGAVSLFVLFFGSEGRRWVKVQASLAGAGLLLWLMLFLVVPAALAVPTALETGRFSDFVSVSARWSLWRISLESALAHPLLGLGPMHFAYVNNGQGAHPHNFWLQLASEWGIPVAVALGCIAVAFFGRLVKFLRAEDDPARQAGGIALLASVATWGMGTLADGYMVVPTSQVMSTIVLMLAVMWLRQSAHVSAGSGESGRSAAGYLLAGLCLTALAVLAALPFTDFGRPTERELAWRAEHPGQAMWPRFWQQGWIGPNDDPTTRQDSLRGWSEK